MMKLDTRKENNGEFWLRVSASEFHTFSLQYNSIGFAPVFNNFNARYLPCQLIFIVFSESGLLKFSLFSMV